MARFNRMYFAILRSDYSSHKQVKLGNDITGKKIFRYVYITFKIPNTVKQNGIIIVYVNSRDPNTAVLVYIQPP